MPTDAIVNKDIPGSINKNVYREYFIKLTSVIPYAKFCILYGNKGSNLVIINRSIAFLFPSSNKSLFKYLFFSTIGFTASLRKNLEIKKEITAAKVEDREHNIIPSTGPNNIPENNANVIPGNANTELPTAVTIIYITDALIILSPIIYLKSSKL